MSETEARQVVEEAILPERTAVTENPAIVDLAFTIGELRNEIRELRADIQSLTLGIRDSTERGRQ